ncbi:unnamed protein product [Thlaspi arvense]|uniref:DNA-directed RNA polymerase III subunit RPC4 n=1 Tax=Thlaspi arvense TaxID=13288 RepID=A0AAU9T4W7_THLAR|nr:unnamed protein product [Thlaspi arvense]
MSWIGKRRPKTETKVSSVEVAFQPNMSSLAIKSFGVPKEDGKHDSDVNPSASSASILPTASSSAISSAIARSDVEEVHNLVTRTDEHYAEHWDYRDSYYPTVLPLRKPYSGDPELRDQEEFGNVAKHLDYDETTINSAEELGLTMIPDCLPVTKQMNTKSSVPENSSNRSNPFEGLPEGFMGKMLVYKSGAVKLKLGDVLYDVSPGPNTIFHNDVAAIDTKRRKCCRVGSSAKFVTVTPDVESLLKSASDMETHK